MENGEWRIDMGTWLRRHLGRDLCAAYSVCICSAHFGPLCTCCTNKQVLCEPWKCIGQPGQGRAEQGWDGMAWHSMGQQGRSLNPPDWNSGSWVMHAPLNRVSWRRSEPGRSTALGSSWIYIEPTPIKQTVSDGRNTRYCNKVGAHVGDGS